MSYPLSATLLLGAGNTGLTLTAALFDGANGAAAGLTTSTLVETDAGTGVYLWTGTIPDGHRGILKFSSGGVVKTAISINPQETENADEKTSIVDSDVWSFPTRTLTQSIQSVSPPPVVDGPEITIRRGDTMALTILGLGSLVGATRIWFTAKTQTSDADSASIIQIDGTTGLLVLNGAPGTAGLGSLVVNNAANGDITITLDESATDDLTAPNVLAYDIQSLISGTVLTRMNGELVVSDDVTRAIA